MHAGIAQLVERNLAKVEVASSRLVSRSKIQEGKPALPFFFVRRHQSALPKAGWQSGYAAACKAVYIGSIPVSASSTSPHRFRLYASIRAIALGQCEQGIDLRFDAQARFALER